MKINSESPDVKRKFKAVDEEDGHIASKIRRKDA